MRLGLRTHAIEHVWSGLRPARRFRRRRAVQTVIRMRHARTATRGRCVANRRDCSPVEQVLQHLGL
eukprot:6192888-Pleurochrysis_carterae.AAC.3